MTCLSRREFLQLVGYSMFMSQLGFPRKSEAVSINPLDWINLIDFSCISCDVDVVGCVDLKRGVAPRITYWLPQAFVENVKKFEFGGGIPVIGSVSSLFQPLISVLTPFIPDSTYSINAISMSQNYMKLYPHWFGFPAPVKAALQTAIATVNGINPICLACNLLSEFIDTVSPIGSIMNEFQNTLQPLVNSLNELKTKLGRMGSNLGSNMLQKLNEIRSAIERVFDLFPFLPAELFFFMWAIESLSPDNHTIAPLFVGLIQALQQINAPASAFFCPDILNYISGRVNLPLGIDLSFLCVGRWGFGYPRVGITRHDDPVVASLLGIARFHHLFSKTIPLLKPAFSFSDVKYQLVSPTRSGCFKVGEYFSDPVGRAMTSIRPESILDLVKSPVSSISGALQGVKESAVNTLNSVNPASIGERALQQRKVGLVVWHRKSKCCW